MAAENVAVADNDGDFDAHGANGFDLLGESYQDFRINAEAGFPALKDFATEFEQDALESGFYGRLAWHLAPLEVKKELFPQREKNNKKRGRECKGRSDVVMWLWVLWLGRSRGFLFWRYVA
jgi:hypothetical protein